MVPFVPEAKSAEEPVNFNLGIRGPHTNVVTMLVCDARAFDTEFEVYTTAFALHLKEFARFDDRCRVGVLGVMNAFGFGESTGGKFACEIELMKMR